MNADQRKSNYRTWLAVYKKELVLRMKWMKKDSKKFQELFGKNPKGLRKESCAPDEHIWVPATHLWIHDGAKGSFQLSGNTCRAFKEAGVYKYDNKIVYPQMCWNCVKVRELEKDDLTFKERLVQQSTWRFQQKATRPRGRKPRHTAKIDSMDIDELLG